MTNIDKNKIKIDASRYLDDNLKDLWGISKYIHENPELAFKEYKSSKIQCEYLEKMGFDVSENIGGLETAFLAKYGSGSPVIAVLSEYDALPELGHACGHNLISTSALGAGIMVRNFLENYNVEGTILVIGTPAEESGGGKIILLNEGVFNGVDAVIMQHPTSYLTRLAGECMSSMRINAKFYGVSAHSGSHPEKGVNALSAANLFMVATGLLRQHFKGDMRFNCIINEGGKATGLVPDYSSVECSASSFSLKDLKNNVDKIKACAEGSAHALGCKLELDIKEGYKGRIPNLILSEACRHELEELGEPLLDGMPFDYGGEDLGNISRVIPICNPYVTIFPNYKISNHTDNFRELSISESGLRCLEIASKAMGRTIIEWFLNPNILKDAKKELIKRMENEEI